MLLLSLLTLQKSFLLKLPYLLTVSFILLLSACSTIPVEERESVRQNLLMQSEQTIAAI
jgi:hypothetical protein